MEFSSNFGSVYMLMKMAPLEGYMKSLRSSFVEVSTMKVILLRRLCSNYHTFTKGQAFSSEKEKSHFLFLVSLEPLQTCTSECLSSFWIEIVV